MNKAQRIVENIVSEKEEFKATSKEFDTLASMSAVLFTDLEKMMDKFYEEIQENVDYGKIYNDLLFNKMKIAFEDLKRYTSRVSAYAISNMGWGDTK